MYKIFIQNRPLILLNTHEVPSHWVNSATQMVVPYLGKAKFLSHFIDKLEKNKAVEQICIHALDVAILWRDFQTLYKPLDAAGGVVRNQKGEILMIFRLKMWDLPKGKIEANELPPEAAVREVQEETGLQQLTLGDWLCDTYHTYELKGKRILKKTYWYHMTTNDQFSLTPQLEEDIEIAQWVNISEFLIPSLPIYPNIRAVLALL